jgi:hypothetical protein
MTGPAESFKCRSGSRYIIVSHAEINTCGHRGIMIYYDLIAMTGESTALRALQGIIAID